MSEDSNVLQRILASVETQGRLIDSIAKTYGSQVESMTKTVESLTERDQQRHQQTIEAVQLVKVTQEAMMETLTQLTSDIDALQQATVALINVTAELQTVPPSQMYQQGQQGQQGQQNNHNTQVR